MSRLDELKEQVVTTLKSTWEKIQESEAYNQLNDKYQTLSPSGQKAAQAATAIIIAGIVFYSPISQVQISSELLTQFEDKRTLIRDMFKTYREASGSLQMVPAPQSSELISMTSFLSFNLSIKKSLNSLSSGIPHTIARTF